MLANPSIILLLKTLVMASLLILPISLLNHLFAPVPLDDTTIATVAHLSFVSIGLGFLIISEGLEGCVLVIVNNWKTSHCINPNLTFSDCSFVLFHPSHLCNSIILQVAWTDEDNACQFLLDLYD
ncbi:hypothetical protein BY996DRAFT_398394 [Phakopsora pachyrhizi]|nr:hypothetical protein BY996DRAFT_398394 [Phakopsora pachyrhizi]